MTTNFKTVWTQIVELKKAHPNNTHLDVPEFQELWSQFRVLTLGEDKVCYTEPKVEDTTPQEYIQKVQGWSKSYSNTQDKSIGKLVENKSGKKGCLFSHSDFEVGPDEILVSVYSPSRITEVWKKADLV